MCTLPRRMNEGSLWSRAGVIRHRVQLSPSATGYDRPSSAVTTAERPSRGLLPEARLDLVQDRHRTGIDPGLQRQLERDVVTEQHEVEELAERRAPFGLDG